MKDKYQLYPGP